MPAERRPLCRACNSQNREEIERRLIDGESGRKVSSWLKKQHGEYISHGGLNGHKASHIPIAGEVRAEVEAQAKRSVAAGIKRRVADVDMLDGLARLAAKTARELAPMMSDPTMAQSTTYAAVLREAREMVKLRDDMLRDKNPQQQPTPVEATFRVELAFPEKPAGDEPAS